MKKLLALLFSIYTFGVFAQTQQEYRSPLDIPLILSANFGELRPNHFHSGIDLKTEGVINKPVYSIADGYISRISVSPSGYGLAIYVTHITGQTSVCGHINKFAPKVAEYVKDKQYQQESYSVDLSLNPEELPVKKGDLIAYSGNTGSSGGPHVHFEIRNTADQTALDPLEYYKNSITDTKPPLIKGIAIYPINEEGAVEFSRFPYRANVSVLKNGSYAPLKDDVEAWGKIGIGVRTNDRMDGTTNIYGVRKVRLFCDSVEIFSSDLSIIDFSKTRMINSMTDFDYWSKRKVFYEKSFIEPSNKLPIYKAVNNGYINIKENRIYNFRYELEDLYGNQTSYSFSVKGKEQTIPQKRKCTLRMSWDKDNNYSADGFSLNIPNGYLYDNLCFMLKKTTDASYLSNTYQVNDTYVPLHGYCNMSVALTKDTATNKAQYGIVRITGTRESWVGGKYENGKITAQIRELGHAYAVSTDTKAPEISPIQPVKWIKNGVIKIRVTDNKSGLKSCKGTIDGKFALFENDVKSPIYSYTIDPKRVEKGKTHKLIFTATDGCGNTSTYEYEFKY